VARKLCRQNAQLTETQDRSIVVTWSLGVFEGDDAVADVNAALSGNLEIALDNVAHKGIVVILCGRDLAERM
jgi:hypothetical protein